jgi:nitrate reductase NapE component
MTADMGPGSKKSMTKSEKGWRAILCLVLAIVCFVAFGIVGSPANGTTQSAVATLAAVRAVADILFFFFLVAAVYYTVRWFRASN